MSKSISSARLTSTGLIGLFLLIGTQALPAAQCEGLKPGERDITVRALTWEAERVGQAKYTYVLDLDRCDPYSGAPYVYVLVGDWGPLQKGKAYPASVNEGSLRHVVVGGRKYSGLSHTWGCAHKAPAHWEIEGEKVRCVPGEDPNRGTPSSLSYPAPAPPTGGSTSSATGPLVGMWTGEVREPSGKRYTAIMKLDGSGGGSIEYPEEKCGGTLTLRGRDGSAFVYQERITYNQKRCTEGGRIRVAPYGNSLEWVWSRGNLVIQAVLTRQGASDSSVASYSSGACDEFCAALRKVIAARENDFIELRGERHEKDDEQSNYWTARLILPGAEYCRIYGVTKTRSKGFYRCFYAVGSSLEESKRRTRELADRVQKAVPSHWTARLKTEEDDFIWIEFGPDSSDEPVGVMLVGILGRALHIDLTVDAN